MKEKRLIEIGEWLNTQGFDLDLSDSFWMEDCRFGEHKVRDIAELLDDFCNQEVEKRIKKRMPNNSWVKQYFYNHFDCHTDFFIDGIQKTEVAMTYQSVLKLFKLLRSSLTCSEKPNNSQKTEGGEG